MLLGVYDLQMPMLVGGGDLTPLCVQLKFYDDALCEQHGLGHLTLATFFHFFFDISQMTGVGKICKYLVNLLPQIDIW